MRLRVVQKDIRKTELGDYLADAVHADIDVVCFGEVAATGCLYTPRPVQPLEQIIAPWRNLPLGIMFGLARPVREGLRNSYLYVQGEQTQVYDKIHLFPPFHEDRVYVPGSEPGFFVTPMGTFGVAICYDIRFDDIFTRFAEAKVERIVIPAAFPTDRIDQWRKFLVRRAGETGATVIGINAVGSDGVNRFGGSSMVVAPDGTITAQADETSEMVLDIEL